MREGEFEIHRVEVQPGLTFSSEAFDEFITSIGYWLAVQVKEHWEETGVAPTRLVAHVSVEIQ